jgi:hypothetical protein
LDRIHNPSAEQLLRTLRGLDESWNTNIGQAWMAWHTDRRAVRLNGPPTIAKSKLVFLRNTRRGWYFEYSDKTVLEMNWQVPFDETRQRGRRVGHFGCDWIYLLPGCFVPLKLVEQIVLDYLETGQPSAAVEWVDGIELRSRIAGDEKDRSVGIQRRTGPCR